MCLKTEGQEGENEGKEKKKKKRTIETDRDRKVMEKIGSREVLKK